VGRSLYAAEVVGIVPTEGWSCTSRRTETVPAVGAGTLTGGGTVFVGGGDSTRRGDGEYSPPGEGCSHRRGGDSTYGV
jgi:hypothetical protein